MGSQDLSENKGKDMKSPGLLGPDLLQLPSLMFVCMVECESSKKVFPVKRRFCFGEKIRRAHNNTPETINPEEISSHP